MGLQLGNKKSTKEEDLFLGGLLSFGLDIYVRCEKGRGLAASGVVYYLDGCGPIVAPPL